MERTTLAAVGARYLTPENTRLFRGRLGSIHCVVNDTEAFANVYCKLCMPVRYPAKFISVWHTNDENKERQIGIIESLEGFDDDARALVSASLSRQYYERTVTRIYDVKWQFGLLSFDVQTEDDRTNFMMRWQHDRALEHGDNGKVLLDVYENRYVIPSVSALPNGDRDRMMRYIYW
jgi:hypothetical protein